MNLSKTELLVLELLQRRGMSKGDIVEALRPPYNKYGDHAINMLVRLGLIHYQTSNEPGEGFFYPEDNWRARLNGYLRQGKDEKI